MCKSNIKTCPLQEFLLYLVSLLLSVSTVIQFIIAVRSDHSVDRKYSACTCTYDYAFVDAARAAAAYQVNK